MPQTKEYCPLKILPLQANSLQAVLKIAHRDIKLSGLDTQLLLQQDVFQAT